MDRKLFRKLVFQTISQNQRKLISYNYLSKTLRDLDHDFGPIRLTKELRIPETNVRTLRSPNIRNSEILCVWAQLDLPIVDKVNYGRINVRIPIEKLHSFNEMKENYSIKYACPQILVTGGNIRCMYGGHTKIIHPNIFNKFYCESLHVCLGEAEHPIHFQLHNLDLVGVMHTLKSLFTKKTFISEFFWTSIKQTLHTCIYCDDLCQSNTIGEFICEVCKKNLG